MSPETMLPTLAVLAVFAVLLMALRLLKKREVGFTPRVFIALGLGIGVAYGIWAASGVALTAVASKFLFKEPFTWVMALGIALIIGGVLLVELGAAH